MIGHAGFGHNTAMRLVLGDSNDKVKFPARFTDCVKLEFSGEGVKINVVVHYGLEQLIDGKYVNIPEQEILEKGYIQSIKDRIAQHYTTRPSLLEVKAL